MSPLRVCVVTPFVTVADGGGVASHARLLSRALGEAGHEVSIISGKARSDKEKVDVGRARLAWVREAPPDTFDPRFWEESRRLYEGLRREGEFDVILSEGSTAFGLLSLRDRPPMISHMHQFKFVHLFNSALEVEGARTLGIYLLKTVPRVMRDALLRERPFLMRSQGVACGAAHMQAKLCRYYGLRPESVRVLPYWVDTRAFRPDGARRAEGRRRWGLPLGAFAVLMLGRIQRTKGLEEGLKSFAQAFQDREEAWLVVAGEGDIRLEEKLKGLARRLGIYGRTLFLGGVGADLAPLVYNLADIFLMPSRILEVLPYTILEAMSTGLPVLAADRPGSREALGEAGIFARPGDVEGMAAALHRLYEDGALRDRLGAMGRDRAYESFSALKVGPRYARYIEELAQSAAVQAKGAARC